ncbi:hypothetical protein BGZ65_010798, partial [Modicella reniformis]
MTDSTSLPLSNASELDAHANLDTQLLQESGGLGNNTVHGIPPFTIPRADGTLEASPDIQADMADMHTTATARMMRRRQHDVTRGDQDGDGNHTNLLGYRDGQNDEGEGGSSSKHGHGLTDALQSGLSVRRPFLQRVRKAITPTLIGGLVAWYFDAVDVLIFRKDPRIKGNILTFSILCLLTVLSIFFYLEFIRPRLLGKKTEYVNWEKELRYPVKIAT